MKKRLWWVCMSLAGLLAIICVLHQCQRVPCRNLPPGYVGMQNFAGGLALVKDEKEHGRFGYIDRMGAMVFKGEFTYVDSFHEGLALAQRFRKKHRAYRFGYIDPGGQVAVGFEFSDARPFSEGLAAVKFEGRYGYIDKSGKMVIEPQFDDAFPFSEGRAKIVMKGRCGFINKDGAIIVEPHYYRAGSFSQGLAMVADKSKCGYIDSSGKAQIPLAFDDARAFSEDCAAVRIGSTWKYINTQGAFLSKSEYDEAKPFSEGLACVGVIRTDFHDRIFGGYSGTAMAYGFIDKSGNSVIEPKFLAAESFSNGLSRVSIPEGDWFGECEDYIFIDRKQRQVSRRLESAESFSDGLALVVGKDRTMGFINTAGRLVLKFGARNASFPGQAMPVRWKRYGFIDTSGALAIKPEYHTARSFSEGLAYVETGTRGYIDKRGSRVIELSGSMIPGDFSEGLAPVSSYEPGRHKSLFGYIDRKGDFVIKPLFYEARKHSDTLAAVKFTDDFGNSWGYIDRRGTVIIPPQYSGAGLFSRGIACVQYIQPRGAGGMGELHYRFIDRKGNTKIDPDRAGFTLGCPGGTPRFRDEFRVSAAGNGESLCSFAGPLMPARSAKPPNKCGYVDTSGAFVITPAYDEAGQFSEGLAPVKINGRWGFISLRGTMVIKPRYDRAEAFSEKLALVEENGRYGYLDPTGKVVIEPQFFEEALSFSDGLALVKMNGRYGYIDTSGTFVIEPVYDDARPFAEGMAVIGTTDFKVQRRNGSHR